MEGTGLVEGRSSWTRVIFQAPFQNFLNSLQSALEDHQNHFCEMFFDLRAVPHMCAVLCHNGRRDPERGLQSWFRPAKPETRNRLLKLVSNCETRNPKPETDC